MGDTGTGAKKPAPKAAAAKPAPKKAVAKAPNAQAAPAQTGAMNQQNFAPQQGYDPNMAGQQYAGQGQMQPQMMQMPPKVLPPKSRSTAGLLGIFLGFSGAHWWYLGSKRNFAIIHAAVAGGGFLLLIISAATVCRSWSCIAGGGLGASAVLGFLGWLAVSASTVVGAITGALIIKRYKRRELNVDGMGRELLD